MVRSGQTSDTRDVIWEVELIRSPRLCQTRGRPTERIRDADLRVSFLQPVLLVTPVPPVTPVLPAPAVLPVTPVMSLAPQMVPPPPGVMSPSSPPWTDNPQVDKVPPDD